MRLPGRRPAPAAEPAPPPGTDAEQQAAWDADGALVHSRRTAILALGVAALLVVAVLVVARARGDGDILALGSSPKSSTTVAPVTNLDPITGDPLFEGSQLIPGDTVPGGGPAGAQPGAPGAVDPGAAAAAAGGGTAPTGEGAATPGDQSGGVAGGGVPIPTTRPGSGSGGATTTPTTQGGGNPPASTTTVPGASPSCSVTEPSANPNPVSAQGQSGKLDDDVTLRFRPSSCGTTFRMIGPSGLNIPAGGNPDGSYSATIPNDDNRGWQPDQTYTISIRNAANAQIGTIDLRVVK